MEREEDVVADREEGDTRGVDRGGGGGVGRREGEGAGGDRQVELHRREANVSSPLAQSMLGLWRCSQGNPSPSWK